MNIEELKLVLEAVRGVSGDASTVIIWWAVLNYGGGIVTSLAGWFTAGYVVRNIMLALTDLSEWKAASQRVAAAYGATDTEYFYESCKRAIDKAVAAAAKENTK